jgi:hypothetical protein
MVRGPMKMINGEKMVCFGHLAMDQDCVSAATSLNRVHPFISFCECFGLFPLPRISDLMSLMVRMFA